MDHFEMSIVYDGLEVGTGESLRVDCELVEVDGGCKGEFLGQSLKDLRDVRMCPLQCLSLLSIAMREADLQPICLIGHVTQERFVETSRSEQSRIDQVGSTIISLVAAIPHLVAANT
jgi:hypothetical protein